MKKVDLYNFSFFKNDCQYKIGNNITLIIPPDHKKLCENIYQSGSLQTKMQWNCERGGECHVEYTPPKPASEPIATAYLEIDDQNVSDKSFLAIEEIEDDGIHDLCELLTFFGGRRVFVNDDCERYWREIQFTNPWFDIHPCQIMPTLQKAWTQRECLSTNNLTVAILLINATTTNIAQTTIFHLATALNIVHDNFPSATPTNINIVDLTDNDKELLKSDISTVLENRISDTQLRDSYIAKINASIASGLGGPIVKLKNILSEIGLLNAQSITKEIENRIKFFNSIRNKILHTGKFPSPVPNGVFSDTSDDFKVDVVPFVCDIFYTINFLAICHVLGINIANSQMASKAKDFFEKGVRPMCCIKSDMALYEQLEKMNPS